MARPRGPTREQQLCMKGKLGLVLCKLKHRDKNSRVVKEEKLCRVQHLFTIALPDWKVGVELVDTTLRE